VEITSTCNDATEVDSCLRTVYAGRPLVRIRAMPHLAQSQHVAHTSYRDVGLDLREGRKRVVPISCLDTLLKRAARRAVQNMDLVFGFGETEGLL
jgi:N-acetyl-gamma-glutamyl-phosphate reductase